METTQTIDRSTQLAIKKIKNTLIFSAITGGPNATNLTMALLGKIKVHFWLDDTIKLEIDIERAEWLDHGRTTWEIKGTFKYAELLFKCKMKYNSFERRGMLDFGRGFIDVDLQLF